MHMKHYTLPKLSTLGKSFVAVGATLALAAWPVATAGADPVCVRSAPSVSYLSAASQSGNPGDTLSYQVRVTDMDSASCGASTQTIDVDYGPATSWTYTFTETFTQTTPGQSVDYTIDLTSPANAQNGDTIWTFVAYEYSGLDTYETDFDMTYSVVNAQPDTTAPTVSIVSPANGSNVAKNSNVVINVNYYDAVGVTQLDFYVDGNLQCTGSLANTCVWHTPNKRGSHTIEVRAYDAAGNLGTATATVQVR